MLLLASSDDFAGRHVQGRKQIEGAVAKVVMRASLGLTDVHGQNGLSSLKRLNLRLFVEREHDGVGGRVNVV